MDIPKDYPMSPDIEDRRNPTIADHIKTLIGKIRDEWEATQHKDGPAPPALGTEAAARIHAKIHSILTGEQG